MQVLFTKPPKPPKPKPRNPQNPRGLSPWSIPVVPTGVVTKHQLMARAWRVREFEEATLFWRFIIHARVPGKARFLFLLILFRIKKEFLEKIPFFLCLFFLALMQNMVELKNARERRDGASFEIFFCAWTLPVLWLLLHRVEAPFFCKRQVPNSQTVDNRPEICSIFSLKSLRRLSAKLQGKII